jgi:hypothetical protein
MVCPVSNTVKCNMRYGHSLSQTGALQPIILIMHQRGVLSHSLHSLQALENESSLPMKLKSDEYLLPTGWHEPLHACEISTRLALSEVNLTETQAKPFLEHCGL